MLYKSLVERTIPRLRPYGGPAILSYGFRPFFLLGSLYAGIAVTVVPPRGWSLGGVDRSVGRPQGKWPQICAGSNRAGPGSAMKTLIAPVAAARRGRRRVNARQEPRESIMIQTS